MHVPAVPHARRDNWPRRRRCRAGSGRHCSCWCFRRGPSRWQQRDRRRRLECDADGPPRRAGRAAEEPGVEARAGPLGSCQVASQCIPSPQRIAAAATCERAVPDANARVFDRHSLFLRFVNGCNEPYVLSAPPRTLRRALTSSRPFPEFVCIGSTIAAHKFATRQSTWAEATANRVCFAHRFSRTLAAETRLGAGFLSHPWTASTITHPPVRLACNGQAAIYPLADADAPMEQLGQDTEAMVVRIERCDCGPVLAMRRRHTHTAASPVRGRSPPLLEWSSRAHAAFPHVFRSAVQTFILCHATLAAVSEDASSPRRVCTLGSLPVVLRDVIIGKAAPRIPSWAPIRLPRPETPVAQDDDQ